MINSAPFHNLYQHVPHCRIFAKCGLINNKSSTLIWTNNSPPPPQPLQSTFISHIFRHGFETNSERGRKTTAAETVTPQTSLWSSLVSSLWPLWLHSGHTARNALRFILICLACQHVPRARIAATAAVVDTENADLLGNKSLSHELEHAAWYGLEGREVQDCCCCCCWRAEH